MLKCQSMPQGSLLIMDIFREAKHQKEYEETGFARASMLSDREVEQLLSRIAELRPDGEFSSNASMATRRAHHVSAMDPDRQYRRRVFELISDYFADKVRDCLPSYCILNANIVIKPPRSGFFEIHQDWAFVADKATKCMTVWCPLVDTSMDNGAVHLLPGSHRLDQAIRVPNMPSYFDDFSDTLVERWLQPVPAKAGHALIWDSHMIHWSGENHTTSPRVAVQMSCIPIQSQPVFIYYDKAMPNRLEIFAADQEFWLTNDHQQLFSRQPHWVSLGYLPNDNQRITEAEFCELLQAKTEQCRTE